MTGVLAQIIFCALTAIAGIGATAVMLSRDVNRLALGLGAFLLAVAGFFALFGFGFLALAELFVYVGGVLVLVLFAIMLVHRAAPGAPALETRHDLVAAIACVGLFGFLLMALHDVSPMVPASGVGPDKLGETLLGDMLPQFELAGALLLAALVAVVAVVGGDAE